jgi:hypothetical protein
MILAAAIKPHRSTKRKYNMRTTNRVIKIAIDREAREAGEIHERDWTFNWDGVSDDDVLELATDSVVITEQRRFRKDPSGFNATADTFNVVDVLRRSPRGPAEPLKRYLATLGINVDSEADARDMVAKMAAKAKK